MKEYRELVLARLDVRGFMARVGVELGARVGPGEFRFTCPFHEDREASANINIDTGLWHCHACNIGGSPIDFLMRKEGQPFKDALLALGDIAGVPAPVAGSAPAPSTNGKHHPRAVAQRRLTEEQVAAWAEVLGRSSDLLRWLHEHRGYTDATIAEYQLGWDGERLTIPIRDEAGELVNVRRYRDPRDPDRGAQGKMLSWQAGAGEARLWPLDGLRGDEVLLVEGEWDCILARQHGFPSAMTVTSGAGIFKAEWTPLFEHKRVAICYDNDEAGRKGAQRVAAMLAEVAEVHIVLIPGLPEKGDVTDFFVEQGRAAEELAVLIADSDQYLLAVTKTAEPEPVASPLYDASSAVHRGQRLRVPVMVSGKATQPFEVPYRFGIKCDLSNKKFCPICPLNAVGGKREVELAAADPKVLGLFNVSADQQERALKELAGAVVQCSRPRIEVKQAINVEELRLIPELDTGAGAAQEAEYVTRTGYLLAHGLRTNRSYEVIGYAHPHPKSQAVVHLLSEAIPAQDNISAFAMTPAIRERLTVFAGEPARVFADVYDDMRRNVHRIQGRPEMQTAYDLVWHSVIGFYFNGAFVRRGWAECMVMGDSGQGKTEMALDLLHHYRLGERVQAEQASLSGLIGGLEKMGDTWILSWGRVPLNDKRLLIIDETQGLKGGQIEAMSDVRATGVAEVVKIRTERTNARCRLIWLANPPSGRPLSQHNQGVLAVKELFEKPEDVRRLDFAVAVASGDVPLAVVNTHYGDPGEPRFSSEACRSLILWAWSRRPEQVRFTKEATEAILEAATAMGRTYHSSIPLVEPSDQRLKLARLSAAAAARCFSTDDGETLVITPEHVGFVVDFLDRVYSAKSLAYGEYSEQRQKGEVLDDDEGFEVRKAMLAWDSARVAVDFLRQATVFRKTELRDVVGWEDDYAKMQLKLLASHRLIRTTREGFVKNPAFIHLLRDMAGTTFPEENLGLDRVDAPF